MKSMKWFVVSFISVLEAEAENQIEFPVYEDFYLFSASSEKELQKKILREKSSQNKAGKGYTLEGIPARLRCLGARKIRSIYNEPPLDIDGDPPGDGTELSHSFMTVKSMKDARKLANGKAVVVQYIDDDDNDESSDSCFSQIPLTKPVI